MQLEFISLSITVFELEIKEYSVQIVLILLTFSQIKHIHNVNNNRLHV